jgi:hypothetical protein
MSSTPDNATPGNATPDDQTSGSAARANESTDTQKDLGGMATTSETAQLAGSAGGGSAGGGGIVGEPFAAGREWLSTDDELLAVLGQALDASDPVPEAVLEGARAAFTWRNIDTELAQIVFDSARELTGVRSEDVNRQVTFEAPGVEIEVMVVENGARRLVGQLVPPTERTVELVGSDSVESAETDRLGRFTFDDIAPGPVRLVVLGADGERLVQTEWVLF